MFFSHGSLVVCYTFYFGNVWRVYVDVLTTLWAIVSPPYFPSSLACNDTVIPSVGSKMEMGLRHFDKQSFNFFGVQELNVLCVISYQGYMCLYIGNHNKNHTIVRSPISDYSNAKVLMFTENLSAKARVSSN